MLAYSRSTPRAMCARTSGQNCRSRRRISSPLRSSARVGRRCPIPRQWCWREARRPAPAPAAARSFEHLLFFVVFRLVYPHLLVEAVGDALQLSDRGVVPLGLDMIQLVFLLVRQLASSLSHRSLMFLLDAIEVDTDRRVIFGDRFLYRDHFAETGRIAVRDLFRRRRIRTIGMDRCPRQRGERGNGNKQFHTKLIPGDWSDGHLSVGPLPGPSPRPNRYTGPESHRCTLIG